jgi:hypothetical protein
MYAVFERFNTMVKTNEFWGTLLMCLVAYRVHELKYIALLTTFIYAVFDGEMNPYITIINTFYPDKFPKRLPYIGQKYEYAKINKAMYTISIQCLAVLTAILIVSIPGLIPGVKDTNIMNWKFEKTNVITDQLLAPKSFLPGTGWIHCIREVLGLLLFALIVIVGQKDKKYRGLFNAASYILPIMILNSTHNPYYVWFRIYNLKICGKNDAKGDWIPGPYNKKYDYTNRTYTLYCSKPLTNWFYVNELRENFLVFIYTNILCILLPVIIYFIVTIDNHPEDVKDYLKIMEKDKLEEKLPNTKKSRKKKNKQK